MKVQSVLIFSGVLLVGCHNLKNTYSSRLDPKYSLELFQDRIEGEVRHFPDGMDYNKFWKERFYYIRRNPGGLGQTAEEVEYIIAEIKRRRAARGLPPIRE